MWFLKLLGRDVLCSSQGWNIEYVFKLNCFQNINMNVFATFLETGAFGCKSCDCICTGVHQLKQHYAEHHGINKVLEEVNLR